MKIRDALITFRLFKYDIGNMNITKKSLKGIQQTSWWMKHRHSILLCLISNCHISISLLLLWNTIVRWYFSPLSKAIFYLKVKGLIYEISSFNTAFNENPNWKIILQMWIGNIIKNWFMKYIIFFLEKKKPFTFQKL